MPKACRFFSCLCRNFIIFIALIIDYGTSCASGFGSLPQAGKLMTAPKADALAGLQDIHLPEPIGWWPPAWGWCVLGLMLMVGLIALGLYIIRRYINGQKKRQALRLLKSYRQEYLDKANSQLGAARVSELLKRVALVYFPRMSVASLNGEAWINFLNTTSKGLDFECVKQELLEIPYKPPKKCDLELLYSLAFKWISQRRVPCLN